MRQAVRARRTPRRSPARAPESESARAPDSERAPAPRRWPVAVWAAFGCAVLYGLLAWQVAVDGPVRELDERAGPALARHAPAGAELLADLGGVWVALPVLVAAMLYAVRRTPVRTGSARTPVRTGPDGAARPVRTGGAGRPGPATDRVRRFPHHVRHLLPHRLPGTVRVPLLAGAAAFAVLPAVVLPLKSAQARPGPKGPLADDYAGFFPSGHAATAAVAYGAVVLLLLPLLRSRAARRLLVAAGALAVLGAGAGLVWREYHWPLDVLAGWCVAGVLLAACRHGAARLTAYATTRLTPDRPDRPDHPPRPDRSRRPPRPR